VILTAAQAAITRAGYALKEWNTSAAGTGTVYAAGSAVTISADLTLYAVWVVSTPASSGPVVGDTLILNPHLVYVDGYPDGTVAPDKQITRAETATIFYRLLKTQGTAPGGSFSDVKDSDWFAVAVNYLASIGIIEGYPDGTFKPSQPITRAEFAAMASRFEYMEDTETSARFSDVAITSWANSYIISVSSKGWMNGYLDGTFRPANNITRAEVVKTVNQMLDRAIDPSVLSTITNPYSDISPTHWAYGDILEASVEHGFMRDSSGNEIWT